jgi:hypothetical protein
MEKINIEDFSWLDPWAIGKEGVLLKVTDQLMERLHLTDAQWQYLQSQLIELAHKRFEDSNPMPPEER